MGHAIPIEAAIDRVAGVLSRTPAGLFTDIDGTISQVARTPSEATVEEPARRRCAGSNRSWPSWGDHGAPPTTPRRCWDSKGRW